MKRGWTNKPTLTSEAARLSNNVLKGFGNNAVFLSTWMVIMLKKDVCIRQKAVENTISDKYRTKIFNICRGFIERLVENVAKVFRHDS